VNELLTYVNVYRDCVSAENLRKVLISFYSSSEINNAKKLLVGTFSSDLADCSYKAERRKSTIRGVNEVEAEDIVGIFEHLDERSHLSKITFAAVILERLPKYGPEEINICSVADKQSELGTSVACLVARVDGMATDHSSSKLAELKDAVTDTVQQGFGSLQAQVTHLANICSQLADGVRSQHGTSVPALSNASSVASGTTSIRPGNIDRSRSIVIFGVEDSRDNVWHNTVLEALRTAAGRDVMINDAVRLGSPTPGKKRPVLVKLQSVWDRRTVLSGSWRLSSTAGFERIFISPDEPLEARRRRSLDRLVKKATAQGKQVSVVDGVLSIDDVTVFSLERGFIQHHDG